MWDINRFRENLQVLISKFKKEHDWIRSNKLMLDKVYKTKVNYKEEVFDYLNTL